MHLKNWTLRFWYPIIPANRTNGPLMSDNNIEITEQEILAAAQERYESQLAWSQRIVPLDAFIADERARRQQGYKKPATLDQAFEIMDLAQQAKSKNVFKSVLARVQLKVFKYRHR